MAIFGTIEQVKEQMVDHPLLKKGIAFLQDYNLAEVFASVSEGKGQKVVIEEGALVANFMAYTSKEPQDTKYEGHRKYTDIQFIFEGEELFGISSLDEVTEDDAFNVEKDIYFPKVARGSEVVLKKGICCVVFPGELHAPAIKLGQCQTVKKVVIKVDEPQWAI